jgi:hypothetical protein
MSNRKKPNKKKSRHGQALGPLGKLRQQCRTLISSVENERKRLTQWQSMLPRIRAKSNIELDGLYETMRQRQRALFFLLDKQLATLDLSLSERETLADRRVMVGMDLLNERDDPEIRSLLGSVTGLNLDLDSPDEVDLDFDNEEDEGEDDDEDDFDFDDDDEFGAGSEKDPAVLAGLIREHFGVEIDGQILAKGSKDEIFAAFAAQLIERTQGENDGDPATPIAGVIASDSSDMVPAFEPIAPASLEQMDEAALKQCKLDLSRQLSMLTATVMQVEAPLADEFDAPGGRVAPSTLIKWLDEEIAEVQDGIKECDEDIACVGNPDRIREWIAKH